MISYMVAIYFVSFGTWKMISSSTMLTLLVAVEMIIGGMLFSFSHTWMMYMNTQCIVSMVVLAVIESVVMLLIVVSVFRESTIHSSFALMF